jgi:hypothetical protein
VGLSSGKSANCKHFMGVNYLVWVLKFGPTAKSFKGLNTEIMVVSRNSTGFVVCILVEYNIITENVNIAGYEVFTEQTS